MSRKRMLVLGILTFCVVLAMTSSAYATTRKTRITGLTSSISALSYRATGRLTYARSGHYYAVSGQYVKVYQRRIGSSSWKYHTKRKTSSSGRFTVAEPAGYTYKFVFAGVRGRYYSCSWTTVVKPIVTGVEANLETLALEAGVTTAEVAGDLWMGTGDAVAPLAGGVVTVSLDGGAAVASSTTDGYGTWLMELPAGDYIARYPGDRIHAPCSSTFSVAQGAETELTTAQDTYVLETGTTARASGVLRADFGTGGETWTPLADATVTISPAEGGASIATTVTGADGAWAADLPIGSYVVVYEGRSGFLAGDGIRYNLVPAGCSFSVTGFPTTDAYADIVGAYEYEVGTPAAGTVTIRTSPDDAIPLDAPLVLNLYVWSDAAEDYVVLRTVTTDINGAWSISGLPLGDEYILTFEENPDLLLGGVHYFLYPAELTFAVIEPF